MPVDSDASGIAMKACFGAQLALVLPADCLQKPDTDIVTVAAILRARITQAHNQFERVSAHDRRGSLFAGFFASFVVFTIH